MPPEAKQPYEIARETVKQLTARKLAPTPENYRSIYHEVAGTRPLPTFPVEPFREILRQLTPVNPGQQKQLALLEYAVSGRNWETFQNALVAYIAFAGKHGESTPTPLAPAASAGTTSVTVTSSRPPLPCTTAGGVSSGYVM